MGYMSSSIQNYKLVLCYKGTNYFGWQKTKMGPSIEEELETSLEKALEKEGLTLQRRFPKNKALQAASRTDRGVHAKQQVVNFLTDGNPSKSPSKILRIKNLINHSISQDIHVKSIDYAHASFHPSTDAKIKQYKYLVATSSFLSPFLTESAWHYPAELSLELMEKGAKLLLGKKDFSAFCNTIASKPLYRVRKILRIEIIPATDGLYQFTIEGEAFLYKMVRNIVGTLVYIGNNKIPLDQLQERIESKSRKNLGVTAPSHGLTLEKIGYI